MDGLNTSRELFYRMGMFKNVLHEPHGSCDSLKYLPNIPYLSHLVGYLNCHLVSNLIGWKSDSLFHVHMFLLFTSKVQHFWNFQPILSNIFFVDQPTSPMPFHATDQPVCSLCLISRRDSMMGRRIVKNNLNNCFIMVSLTYN